MATNPIDVKDIVQAVIQTTVAGQVCLNVLHYVCQSLPEDTDYSVALPELAGAIADPVTGVVPAMQACVSPEVTFNNITVQRVSPTRNYYIRGGLTGVGTRPGSIFSPNVALSITKQVDESGRGLQGHFQLAGCVATDATTDGRWQTTLRTLANNLGTRLTAALVIGAGSVPVWYPCLRSVAAPGYHVVTRYLTQGTIRTMHRRTVGLGI